MRRQHFTPSRYMVLGATIGFLATLSLPIPTNANAQDTAGQDSIEALSGSKLVGKITARDDKYVTIQVMLQGRTYARKFPVKLVHAITVDGKREILNAKSGAAEASPTGPLAPGATAGRVSRTPAQVDALIDKLGRTKPDWWDKTKLDFPKTLDLSWPQPPPPGWNNRRNVGQYIWDIVNQNPSQWRRGIRFMRYLLDYHKSNATLRNRVMNEMGRMYHNLLQDYARAAFWWQQAGVDRENSPYARNGVFLAECYWKLGSKQKAMELIRRTPMQFATIKLLGEMGELETALRVADANMNGSVAVHACIAAGDACRAAGEYEKAIGYYQELLAMSTAGMKMAPASFLKRMQRRAQANIEGIRLYNMLDLSRVPDGTYRAGSLGYEDQVQVEVVVRSGRIESVEVVQHREKQFYSALEDTTRQIVQKQGVKDIDATTSATITSEAIINATAKALATAMK